MIDVNEIAGIGMVRSLLLTLAFSVAGCGGVVAKTDDAKALGKGEQGLAAPVADDVAVRIGADKNGQSVAVPVGRRVAVELVGVPTAGYIWEVVSKPDFMAEAETLGGPTSKAQRQPGFAGGEHWEVFVFDVTAAGEGELRLEQRRPWEKNEPPTQVFTARIEAR